PMSSPISSATPPRRSAVPSCRSTAPDPRSRRTSGRTTMPSTNRRSFLAHGAALAAVPTAAALVGGAFAEPAFADDTLPDYAPIPPSALGPAVNAQGYYVGRVQKNLYWV